jgi:hypothetical protein
MPAVAFYWWPMTGVYPLVPIYPIQSIHLLAKIGQFGKRFRKLNG